MSRQLLPLLTLASKTNRATILSLCLFALILPACAQQPSESSDPEKSRFEVYGGVWLVHLKGDFHDASGGNIDVQRDLHINSSPGFLGILRWKFARKHSLIFETNPSQTSRTSTLQRTITFQGSTFDTGATINTNFHLYHWYPQYQYNFFQRKRWHLGLNVGVDLFNFKAQVSGTATIVGPGGTTTESRTVSRSLFAGLPTGGFEARLFPFPKQDWLDVNGHIRGMYFFGYGRYLESRLSGEVRFYRHLGAQGGYQFLRETTIHSNASSASQFGFGLKGSGPLFGLTARW